MGLMSGWPDQQGRSWDGPVLWLAGGRSEFIGERHRPAMAALFPNVELEVVPDAGHWVHAEQPQAVAEAIRRFITRD